MKKYIVCFALILAMSFGAQELNTVPRSKSNAWIDSIEKLLSPLFQEFVPTDEVAGLLTWVSSFVKRIVTTITNNDTK